MASGLGLALWLLFHPPVSASVPSPDCLTANEALTGKVSPEIIRKEQEQREYVESFRSELLESSEALRRDIEAANQPGAKPYVVDVVGVGAGPENVIAFANVRAESPTASTLIFEMDNRAGTFDKMRGFVTNTYESPTESGNTFPGLPIQPRDLNPRGRKYVPSSNFGDVTLLGHKYLKARIAFQHKVLGTEEEPSPGAWPAPYKVHVETPDADGRAQRRVVYAKRVILNTGMGRPEYHINHPPTVKLIAEEEEKTRKALQDYSRHFDHVPGIQSGDQFLRQLGDDTNFGVNPMARYGNGTILVVGKMHGGAIAVEGATGLNAATNPQGISSTNPVLWLGQPAKTAQQYRDSLAPQLVDRYHHVGEAIESKRVETIPGYLVEIEKIREGDKTRFRVTYAEQLDGSGERATRVVDHIVLSTGYRNEVAGLYKDLNGNPASLIPLNGPRSDFTHNAVLGQDGAIGSQVVTILPDGTQKKHNVFVAGNSNLKTQGGVPITPEEYKNARGGFIDILGIRSASLGREVGRSLGLNYRPTPLNASPLDTAVTAQGLPYPRDYLATDYLFRNYTPSSRPLSEGAAELETKIETARFISQFRMPDSRNQVSFSFTRDPEGIRMGVHGLDFDSARMVSDKLGQNPRLLQLLDNLFRYHAREIRVRSHWRNAGGLRTEDLTFSIEH